LHIVYKDIEYISSYFGKPETWIKNNSKAITTFFYNKIDDEVYEAIKAIDIKPKSILDIIDKYNLPKTRDLMLMKAMDKYASEMATLLSSIENADLKKSF
jgi:predicted CopG family antitoxin